MHAALLITGKDLRQRLRDRSAYVVGILVPLALAFVFNLAFGGLDDGSGLRPTYTVVNQDAGPLGAAFVGVLRSIADEDRIALVPSADASEARTAVEAGDVDAAFVLPSDLTTSVTTGGAPTIAILGAAASPLSTQVASAIAEGFAGSIGRSQLAVATATSLDPQLDATSLGLQVVGLADTVTVVDGPVAARQLDTATYLSAGMAIFFVFFTVQFGVSSLLDERRDGTLPRLRAAPVASWSIVAGKSLTSVTLGVASLTTLAIGTTVFLGAEWGSPVGVGLLIVAAVAAATGIMAVVSMSARTIEQANVGQSVIAVLMAALGGVFFDISQGSDLMNRLSLLTPHRWFLRGLGDVRAGGAGAALPSTLALLSFGAVALAIATLVARRTARR